jgi:hypothetical protein
MSIEDARRARASQALDKKVRLDSGEVITRRAFMDRLRTQGGKVIVRREENHAATEKLRRDIERRARSYPMGNPNHPETLEYHALRAKLDAGIFKEKTYVMLPSGTHYEISKAELDYFEGRTGSRAADLSKVIDLPPSGPRLLSSPLRRRTPPE